MKPADLFKIPDPHVVEVESNWTMITAGRVQVQTDGIGRGWVAIDGVPVDGVTAVTVRIVAGRRDEFTIEVAPVPELLKVHSPARLPTREAHDSARNAGR
jgi:hypothetical protein